jgi:manganese transport protein
VSETARVSISGRTAAAAAAVLAGRSGWLGWLAFAGPAVTASVAYMDPGNFATNIQAGAGYGYSLLWVVVLANLLAMLFQALSARLGIVSGHSLATLCRREFPPWLVMVMWLVSELAAMATDLAELLGAALGLSLLAHLPLLPSLLAATAGTWAMLGLQRHGFRPIELVVGGFVVVIGLCYVTELFIAPPDWPAFLAGAVIPRLQGPETVTLAVGIVGATVMPHAIYLHSSLILGRVAVTDAAQRRRLIRYSNLEVVLALGAAGLVNMAMLATAATAFHAKHSDIAQIETAYHTLAPLLGPVAAWAFMASLLASGFSASVVGTMAGQVIMQDFTGWRVPLWVRRLVTMLPALAVVALGYGVTESLILSQVVLSMVLPVPIIALLVLLRRPGVMGKLAVGGKLMALAWAAGALILLLNLMLVLQLAGVLPGG